MTTAAAPVGVDDQMNTRILAVSEDRLAGFWARPFEEVSRLSGVPEAVVLERVRAMLAGGTIRRVRQTVMATNLAPGALVAWEVSPQRLDAAFNFMFEKDPFSGHVVVRTTDSDTPGSSYRLWTTLKVPQGFSMDAHCRYLMRQTGSGRYRLMPAKCLFTLGVGHMRRRGTEPGSKTDGLAEVTETNLVPLDEAQWRVLMALKRELEPGEIVSEPWRGRAAEAGLEYDAFCAEAEKLNQMGVIGRFSTFLEHVKKLADGQRVTRFNALFHWAVPAGREIEAGREVGRHHVLTHAYWREAGDEFHGVNIMAVAHGTEKKWLLDHKRAIDEHLESCGIPVAYTNVFWGGRSEIKPSEISPIAYRQWCEREGLDLREMAGGAGE